MTLQRTGDTQSGTPLTIAPPAGGGGGGSQNLFETVAGDSGSAVADTTTDTLTLAGGTGITTTGQSTPDKVTIDLDTPVAIANGGTNASSFALTNGIALYDGSKLATGTITHPATNKLDKVTVIQAAGAGGVSLYNSSGTPAFQAGGGGTLVNYIIVTGRATGVSPSIAAIGETNLDLLLQSAGTGVVKANGTPVLLNVVEDTTPQLGGMLDVNGQSLGDGTNKLLSFVEDGLAVNNLEIENEATGAGPILRAVGSDAVVDLHIEPKGADAKLIVDSTATASYLYLLMLQAGAVAEIGTSGAATLDIGGAVESLRFSNNADAHIYGGISSGNDLYLHSTSHATKGQVFFGATGAVTYNGTNGYLGVGTTNPTNAKLEIQGSTGVPLAWLEEDGNGANFQVYSHKTAAGGSSQFRMYKSRGSKASPTVVVNQDQLGVLGFYGYEGALYKNRAAVQSRCDAAPTSSPSSMPMDIRLSTGRTSTTKRLTISSLGAATFQGNVAFNNKTPASPPNYTRSGSGTNRSIDYVTSSTTTVRQVLATLVQDLIDIGLLQ